MDFLETCHLIGREHNYKLLCLKNLEADLTNEIINLIDLIHFWHDMRPSTLLTFVL